MATQELHLRDYQHAKNLYYEYGMAFAPKTKFLYHCLFEPSPEVGNSASANSFAFQKQIGVLVKTADLPSFRVSVDNKKQYNRIKQFQTRIDYNDINITFHDDNTGVTRALFEEYYKFYWIDGRHSVQKNALVSGPYATRDKYSTAVPKYGLNNKNNGPFFSSITLYQLSRRQWFAYTLVNPLITQWNHGSVDASDGAGMNENTMSIAYEAVLYTNGQIGENSQPVAFADPDTGYDQHESILINQQNNESASSPISRGPKLLDPVVVEREQYSRNTNQGTPQSTYDETELFVKPGAPTVVPKHDSQVTTQPSTGPAEDTYRKYSADAVGNALSKPGSSNGNGLRAQQRLAARRSFSDAAVNAGAIPGYNNADEWRRNTTKEQRETQIDELVEKAGTDQKLNNLASSTINAYKQDGGVAI